MSKIISKRIFYLAILLSIFLLGCESLQKSINNAEKAIKEAEKINANKYAPTQLNDAKKKLTFAKAMQDEDKKTAMQSAIASKKRADQAYSKAVNEFISSQQETTRQKRKAAKASHADIVSPEKFNEAVRLSKEVDADIIKLKALQKKLVKLEKGK